MPTPTHLIRRALLLSLTVGMLEAADYHISPSGNDAADGLSATSAWKTLQRANETTYQPGDRLLFESGGSWTGKLCPKGSGTPEQPIRLSRYGKGKFPQIAMGGEYGPVVSFENQDCWEIAELEITGRNAPPEAIVGGIHFVATNANRILRHIVVRNCIVRDLGGSFKEYESCGIWVGVRGWNQDFGLTTTFEGVRIEHNRIRNTGRCGILVWTCAAPAGQAEGHHYFQNGLLPSKDVSIRKNIIEEIGGDAILVLGSIKPLIESNTVRRSCLRTGDPNDQSGHAYNKASAAIWLHSCLGGVMQFNQVYQTGKQPGNNDGMSFDFDFNCRNCLLQYNFSHSNQGGFLLIMPSAIDNIARYNLSINDRDHVLFLVGKLEENNLVHNNTFHITEGHCHLIPRARIWNNIFLVGGNATMEEREGGGDFRHNAYFGNWKNLPGDASPIKENPQLHNPLPRSHMSIIFPNYTPRKSSPCRAAGFPIPNNSPRDLAGNVIPQNTPPDIGALQSPTSARRANSR